MSKGVGLKKLPGLAIIIVSLLLLVVQTSFYSSSFSNTSSEAVTVSILTGGGIVLGSYLVLGPLGILVSLVALGGAGCVAEDLGEPPEPPLGLTKSFLEVSVTDPSHQSQC